MEDGGSVPLASVDLDWLQSHLAELRRLILSKPDSEIRKAAKVAIIAAQGAIEEDDLRLAVLQYTAAAFLVDGAKSRTDATT